MQTFYIIGISDDRNQFLSPEIRNLVSQGKVFSGGKRHHELVHAYLPEDAVWIDITVPLDAVFSTIAARMLEYGYDNYRMTVGEALGNGEEESVRTFSLEEASQSAFRFPNCLILQRNKVHPRPFGIPESEFHLLNGRNRMITKMPVRLLTLSMLTLREKKSFWDIGFCTGSVSIEAKLQFPELKVTAFEQRPEGKELMARNSRKFGTPGITTVMGDFLETELGGLPAPDAVFIGGHGGKMIEILQKIKEVLLPDGVIVFNSVSEESKALFTKGITQINKKVTQCTRIAVDAFNPIEIMRAE